MTPDLRRVPPPFEQIADHYAYAIYTGQLAVGDFLPSAATLTSSWGVSKTTAARATERLHYLGLIETVPGKGLQVLPHDQPVAMAVVTSDLGMLVTWRNDKEPPAGFLSGEIEPGETAVDAMVRECKEEASLVVVPGEIVGHRTHPRSKRFQIYVAGRPAEDTDVHVGDKEELAAVRWVTLAEADAAFEAFGGMYPPVHDYLRKVLSQ
jgi:DNA-binding transcriptional regulator YhcF (GntR family)